MEALLCAENANEGPFASEDLTLINDPRVIDNLLTLQITTMPSLNYFALIQTDIDSHMRKVVATWMLEVCEEQACEDQVFGVAMNFLDRFLCITVLQRSQLQLVGAVCLLIASKIRQCKSLSVEILAYYTENSVSYEEIKKWELVVVSKMGWDLSPVTAGDFLEHLIRRIPGASQNSLVRRHAYTFIALAATDAGFIQVEPSALAVGALIAAVRGLRFSEWQDALVGLASVIEADPSALERIVQMIEATIDRESAMLPPSASQTQQNSSSPPATPTSKHHQPMEFFDGNETPTDLLDIIF